MSNLKEMYEETVKFLNDIIQEFDFVSISDAIDNPVFWQGVIYSMIIFGLLIVIFKILFLFYNSSNFKGIINKSENCTSIISPTAVKSLLIKKLNKISNLRIKKIIFQQDKVLDIRVIAIMNNECNIAEIREKICGIITKTITSLDDNIVFKTSIILEDYKNNEDDTEKLESTEDIF